MPAGRPPIFKTSEELQTLVDSYFDDLPTKEIHLGDGRTIELHVATITGLTLHLGFSDRASFYDYEKRPEFSHTIKTARTRIENDYEMQLRTQSAGHAGTIFGLKNLGWKDQTERKVTLDVTDMTDDQLTSRIRELENAS